jgi:hypothetical protein
MFIDKNISTSSSAEEKIMLSQDFIKYKKDLISTLEFIKDYNDIEVTSKIKILIFKKIFTEDIFVKTKNFSSIIGDTTSSIYFKDISSHLFGSLLLKHYYETQPIFIKK